METIPFEIRLVDSVGGPARRAASALKQMEQNARRAQDALSFSKEMSKAESGIRKLAADPKGFVALIKAQKELRERREKLRESVGMGGSLKDTLKEKLGFGHIASAAAFGTIAGEGIIKAGELLLETAHKFVEIFTEGFSKALEESAKSETLKLGFKLSLGDKGGKEAMEDIARFSKQTGFDEEKIAKLMLPLRSVGMSQQAARSSFAAAGDIATQQGRGGDLGLIGGFMESFKDIYLKGGVTKKMLPGMNVKAEPFYKSLGKQLKISPKEAEKRASETGGVDSQMLLNTIWEQIESRQNKKLGSGLGDYSKTLEGRWDKLKELPNQFFRKMDESPAFAKLSESLGAVLEKLDPEGPVGQRIIASLKGMFEKIVSWFDKLTSEEGLNNLADGIEGAVASLGKAVEVATKLVHAFEAAASIAMTLGQPMAAALKLVGVDSPTDDLDIREKLRRKYAAGEIKLDDLPGAIRNDAPKVAGNGGKSVTLNAPMSVTLHASGDEDTKKKAHQAAVDAGRHMSKEAERAAQELGAQ